MDAGYALRSRTCVRVPESDLAAQVVEGAPGLVCHHQEGCVAGWPSSRGSLGRARPRRGLRGQVPAARAVRSTSGARLTSLALRRPVDQPRRLPAFRGFQFRSAIVSRRDGCTCASSVKSSSRHARSLPPKAAAPSWDTDPRQPWPGNKPTAIAQRVPGRQHVITVCTGPEVTRVGFTGRGPICLSP
jgi:hypothetical protein